MWRRLSLSSLVEALSFYGLIHFWNSFCLLPVSFPCPSTARMVWPPHFTAVGKAKSSALSVVPTTYFDAKGS